MTSRERVLMVARGETVDRAPAVVYQDPEISDLVVCSLEELAEAQEQFPDKAIVVEVESPFSRALNREIDLNAELTADPAAGHATLEILANETKVEGDTACSLGADGVWYHLEGADPVHCSPMQYGGYYLELDRELLARWQSAPVTVVAILGAEPYLDFVCDLPAHFFAYDAEASGVTSAAVREIRSGAIASQLRDADLRLVQSSADFSAWTADLEAATR